MIIYFFKHTESTYNSGLTKSNCRNPVLSENGINQAKKIMIDVDCVILTPLKRSIQTFSNAQVKCSHVEICDLFRERMVGEDNFLEREDYKFETQEEFENRIKKSIEKLKEYSKIKFISHFGFINEFTKVMTGKSITPWKCTICKNRNKLISSKFIVENNKFFV